MARSQDVQQLLTRAAYHAGVQEELELCSRCKPPGTPSLPTSLPSRADQLKSQDLWVWGPAEVLVAPWAPPRLSSPHQQEWKSSRTHLPRPPPEASLESCFQVQDESHFVHRLIDCN